MYPNRASEIEGRRSKIEGQARAIACLLTVAIVAVLASADGPTFANRPTGIPRGFREIKRDRGGRLPKLTEVETRRGYLVFTRPEPGDIYPTSVPTREQTVDKLSVRVTPGRIADIHFALRPLKSFRDVRVTVGFEGRAKKWPADLRWVHCWPQRTAWSRRARQYHVIPELLLKRQTGDLAAARTQPFYLTVGVPPDAKPGTYRGHVALTTAGTTTEILALKITVLPFKLAPLPKDVTFGLYADIGAWAKDRTSTLRGMTKIRHQGFNALMIGCPGTWTCKDGKVFADLTPAIEFMERYKAAGFDGRTVMRLDMSGYVNKWVPKAVKDPYTYTPEAQDVLRQIYRIVRTTADKHKWPPFAAHIVDEPPHQYEDERMQRGVRQAKVLHAAGFDVFSTIWEPGKLDPYLNYRGYNCIRYISFPDEKTTRARRKRTLKAGDHFWFYGSGCYADEHVRQDGNIIANRYMSGNLAWRAGATGSWSWTFMRTRGHPYYDLDDGRQRHASKDAMTVYPPVAPDKDFTPTLQWHALRIGIDDWRYFHTLSLAIKRATASGNPPAHAAAERIEANFNTMLKKMPWTHTTRGRYPASGITNAMLTANREKVIDWILKLNELIDPN